MRRHGPLPRFQPPADTCRICSDFDNPVRAEMEGKPIEDVGLDHERAALLPAHSYSRSGWGTIESEGRKHRAVTGRRLSAGMLLWLSRGRNRPVTRVDVIACPAVASS